MVAKQNAFQLITVTALQMTENTKTMLDNKSFNDILTMTPAEKLYQINVSVSLLKTFLLFALPAGAAMFDFYAPSW